MAKTVDFSRALTVGEVAKRSGVPVSTVHFYEAKGLIASTRNSGNQRRFDSVVFTLYCDHQSGAAYRDSPGGNPRGLAWFATGQQAIQQAMASHVQPLAGQFE